MSVQSTAAALAINFFSIAFYYSWKKPSLSRKDLLIQCSGIAISSLENSARSFSDPYLQNWLHDHQLDYIHGSFSCLMIGFTGNYANISLKTNLTASLIFTGIQIGTHKLCSHFFKEPKEHIEGELEPLQLFPSTVVQSLKERYQEIVRESLCALDLKEDYDHVHRAILENRLDAVRNFTIFESIKNLMISRRQETEREMRALCPTIPPSSPEQVEDEEVNEELEYYVNYTSTKNNLTPMHVAVMTNNIAAARILIESGKCKLSEKDCNDATPLHHAAALGNKEFIQFLIDHGADKTAQDGYEGTYEDILSLCHRKINPADQRIFVRLHSGEVVEETGVQFFEKTQARLLKSNIALSPRVWLKNWETRQYVHELTDYEKSLKACYLEFTRNTSPKVWVDYDQRVGCFLRAGQLIPRFTIIGEYFGKIDSEDWEKKSATNKASFKEEIRNLNEEERSFFYVDNPSVDYNIGAIDAFSFRGLMGLVADSFPNVIAQPVMSARGVYQRTIFIAATDIQKEEILAFDYGEQHQVKRMPFKELRQEAMDSFFKDQSQENLLTVLKTSSPYPQDRDQRLAILAMESQLDYLINSPTAMLSLYLEGILRVDTLKSLFKEKYSPKGNPGNPFSMFQEVYKTESMQQRFLDAIETFDDDCLECDPDIVNQVKKGIFNKIGKVSTLELYRTLSDPTLLNQDL